MGLTTLWFKWTPIPTDTSDGPQRHDDVLANIFAKTHSWCLHLQTTDAQVTVQGKRGTLLILHVKINLLLTGSTAQPVKTGV